MSKVYQKIIRPILFRQDPERVHHRMKKLLPVLGQLRGLLQFIRNRELGPTRESVEFCGLRFPNRVGLAAGMDKDGEMTHLMDLFGFGHVEAGTVTPRPQPGNPLPRLFRYPEHGAIVNRMGFNNGGATALARRLEKSHPKGKRHIPVGINIGKNKDTPTPDAPQDYLEAFEAVRWQADYVAINVSSPNTEGLRDLQQRSHLQSILRPIASANRESAAEKGGSVPILLKIAPDLSFREVDLILETVADEGIDGLILTNTTIQRPGPCRSISETGGLSGRPLRRASTDMIRYVHRATAGKLPIIGVGGIDDADSADEKLSVGATLLQIYTGWIFEGPFLPARIARAAAGHQRTRWI